jgi:hypothetical protein
MNFDAKMNTEFLLHSHETLELSRPSNGHVSVVLEGQNRAKTARLSRDVQMRNVRE